MISFAERVEISKEYCGFHEISSIFRTQIEADRTVVLSYFQSVLSDESNLIFRSEIEYLHHDCRGRRRFIKALLDLASTKCTSACSQNGCYYEVCKAYLRSIKPKKRCLSRKKQFTSCNKYQQISRKLCLLMPSIMYICSVENDLACGCISNVFAGDNMIPDII